VGDQAPFLPTRHGFDEFYGLPYSNDMGMMIQWPRYPPLPLMREEAIIQEQPDQAGLTERYVEESVRFLRANRDRPFFLYLAHMYVHVPLFVPEHFRADSRNGAYGAAVACIDWAAAALFRELKALGIDGNTLVIFTSDNGSSARDGGSNAPLRGAKGSTWEGGQRLPCIMRWPGVIPGGTTCGEIASAIDFLPTFAGMAGAKVPTDRVIDGRNILPLMRGDAGARSPHEAFYYYRAGHLEAVRSGRWKWRLVPGELYNLERDVGEQTNVAGDNPEVVRSLQALAERGRADIGDLATGTVGSGSRPVGKVENPVTLTQYDPSHPYIVAMYDCAGRTTPREKQVAQKPASEKFVWPVVGPQ
jgi:arylsulfatase A